MGPKARVVLGETFTRNSKHTLCYIGRARSRAATWARLDARNQPCAASSLAACGLWGVVQYLV